MKYLPITIALLVIITGCTSDPVPCQTYDTVSIVGNLSVDFQHTTSRSENSRPLEDGSNISFYSSGGLSADNLLLTYHKGRWSAATELQWNTEHQDAHVAAYYPALTGNVLMPYENDGSLKDILYSTSSVGYRQPVILQFHHLFSQLIFHVDATLNRSLEKIRFTLSASVKSIDFQQAQVNYILTQTHTTELTKREDGIYNLIVPSVSNLSVDIQLIASDKSYTAQLLPSSFEQGYQYTYNLKSDHKGGISTAEDFIAFTRLINGEAYGNRTLDEFGTVENGTRTYYLLNDIHFTPEECARLQPIGYYDPDQPDNKGFKDCLDGQNHTLYDLQLSPKEAINSYGLFSFIDTTGIIKDLNLANVSYSSKYVCRFEALLVGRNNGTITGCHINGTNTFIGTAQNCVGGIAALNRGCIINCSIENIDFQMPQGTAGGVSYNNYGKILNCYTSGCNFLHTLFGAGICYSMETKSELRNCYAYKTAGYRSKKKYASLVYISNYGNIENGLSCDEGVKAVYSPYQTTPQQIYTYDPTTLKTESGTSVVDILNNWIENNASLYPQYTFYDWITGDTPPVILQHP